MYSIIPLFKSHHSLGKSILTLDKPSKDDKQAQTSIFTLAKQYKLPTIVLVEDDISGLLGAARIAEENKVKLIFGLRLNIVEKITPPSETEDKDKNYIKSAKYIIFCKNAKAYTQICKIWSKASSHSKIKYPLISFQELRELWTDDLILIVPFYDSFLSVNALQGHMHVPDFSGFGEVNFLVEDNNVLFDDLIRDRVTDYCAKNHHGILKAQSIYYRSKEDYLAYIAYRCLHNRNPATKSTLEKPELNHMSSDEFNFEKWLSIAKIGK